MYKRENERLFKDKKKNGIRIIKSVTGPKSSIKAMEKFQLKLLKKISKS